MQVTVAVPPWRNDIAGAGGLDQAVSLDAAVAGSAAEGRAAMEPEARPGRGGAAPARLDSVPPVSMPAVAPVPLPALTPRQVRAAVARRTLAARGLMECVTFSFLGA